jgi:hypothetical protein
MLGAVRHHLLAEPLHGDDLAMVEAICSDIIRLDLHASSPIRHLIQDFSITTCHRSDEPATGLVAHALGGARIHFRRLSLVASRVKVEPAKLLNSKARQGWQQAWHGIAWNEIVSAILH